MATDPKVIQSRHVLAVARLDRATQYLMDKLGLKHDFSAPGWEFLSFGSFKVMLGECPDALTASETGDHSYFAHVLVENIDELYSDLGERGAKIISRLEDKPWGLREFGVVTPDGHRITFGQEIIRATSPAKTLSG